MKTLEISNNGKSLKLIDEHIIQLNWNFFDNYEKVEDIEIVLNNIVRFSEQHFSFFNNIIKLSITAESLENINRECFLNMKKLRYLYLDIPKVSFLPYFYENHKLKEVKLWIPNTVYLNYMFSFNFYLRYLQLTIERNITINKIFKNNTLPFLEILIILNVSTLKITLEKKFIYSLYHLSTLKLIKFNLKDKSFTQKIFKMMPRLRKLFLIECLINNLHFLKKLRCLIKLDLSSNLISWTASAFENNYNLEYLNLSNNPFIITIQTLKNLPNLLYLNWTDCRLQRLERNCFKTCRKTLQTINLSNNLLYQLDCKLFDKCYNLKNLILSNNFITTIHNCTFNSLINLVHLSLQKNTLSHLDVNIFSKLINLENLNLGYNILLVLNSEWFKYMEDYNLKYLTLSNNNINELIMTNLTLLSRLININLRNNNILNIDQHLFINCKNLMFLDLSINTIRIINKNSFIGLVNLKDLILKQNIISIIEMNSFDTLIHLEVLNLESNLIKNLEQYLFNCNKNLKFINLCDNFIENIPENLLSFNHQIQWLNISNNRINDPNEIKLIHSSSKFQLILGND